ncbi:MAG TPA: nickel-dependent lactate racemase [Dictyobacter sp.]|jgi:nickel-dependent lactate racemase|nr:nickel-dependent lactate racemase [Dictyobacter sp.]
MDVHIPYGNTRRIVQVPEHTVVLRSQHSSPLPDERLTFQQALRQPIGNLSLAKRVQPHDRIAIVISDITRPTPNERIVPWILDELSFIPRSQFIIINGTGSHRANTRDELCQMLGDEIVETVEIANHDAFDEQTLVYLGESASGSPVWINQHYIEADFRIVTGFIEPHFFAGFSGGAKGIVPGIAGIATIQHLHSAPLIGDTQATWAVLQENPIHRGIQDAVSLCPPEFMVNVTLDQERHITGVFAGDYIKAHYEGCTAVARLSTQEVESPFDIVITSNNGYPLDQNLYQSVKGMTAAAQITRQGGTIVTIAECRDGLPDHGNYKSLLQMGESPANLLELIHHPGFQMHDQWQVQKQAQVQLQANVYLHSSLPEGVVQAAQLLPAPDLQGTIDTLLQKYGPQARVAILPEGPVMVPYIKEPNASLA